MHIVYRKTRRQNYTYSYTYLFSILCMEFHVARMQNKICQSFPNHIQGSAGLIYTKLYM